VSSPHHVEILKMCTMRPSEDYAQALDKRASGLPPEMNQFSHMCGLNYDHNNGAEFFSSSLVPGQAPPIKPCSVSKQLQDGNNALKSFTDMVCEIN